MSSTPLSPFRKFWYKWKALRLPWRKRFLVGLDLQGNTFWEFHDALSHKHRMRRIVQYPPSVHYSEIVVSPQWHQWLRHTRSDPPSLTEQSQDLVRQRNLKILAAEADKRWAAKPSFLDAPKRDRIQSSLPSLESQNLGGDTAEAGPRVVQSVTDTTEDGLGNRVRQSVVSSEEIVESQLVGDATTIPISKGTKQTLRKSTGGEIVDDPWRKARGGPSEEWQPAAWDGKSSVARR